MNDNNLDDLIIDTSSKNSGNKSKNIISLVVLFAIILLIAFLLTKIMIDEPKPSPLADMNETQLANDDLLLDTNNTDNIDLNESATPLPADTNDSSVEQVIKEESTVTQEITTGKQVQVPAVAPKAESIKETVKETVKEVVKTETPKVEKKAESIKKDVKKVEKKAEPAKEIAKKETQKVVEKKAEPIKKDVKKSEEKVEPAKEVVKKETPKVVEKQAEPTKSSNSNNEYYIQAGAFGSAENVSKAESAIAKSGLKYKSLKREKGTKVMVGPFNSIEEAQSALSTVKAKVNPDAFIAK